MADKILIVDDEVEIADLVELYLKNENFEVYKFYTAQDALACIESTELDLAILDIMLPGTSGFDICQKIREKHNYPVIMLTAKIEETDKITGLTLGADDYITKPFRPLEMVARVKAQLRRYTRYNESRAENRDVLDFNGLVINRGTHQCWLYDQELSLTPIEFDILWMLSENRGQVISAERLFETVWGEKYLDRNNTVMVHIRRIREKLGDTDRGDDRIIKTVWGVGYRIG